MYRPQLTVLNSFSTAYITNLHSVFQPLQRLFQPDIPSSWNAPSASLSHHGSLLSLFLPSPSTMEQSFWMKVTILMTVHLLSYVSP